MRSITELPLLTTDFVDRAVDLYGDVVGVGAHDGAEYTDGEFAVRVNRLSNRQLDLGIEQGDRAGFVSGTTHNFLDVPVRLRTARRGVRADQLPADRPGYFHTGDIAIWDEHGMLAVQDRKTDVIISGSENGSSIGVEDALYDHPDVLRAAVIGVPSDEWGEAVHALVVPVEEAALTEDAAIEFARDTLTHYKAPKSVELVDDLPETATGTVQTYELRAAYWQDEGRMISG